jgi:hypothetical protein
MDIPVDGDAVTGAVPLSDAIAAHGNSLDPAIMTVERFIESPQF